MVWFGEIERKLAKLSMTTITYSSLPLIYFTLATSRLVQSHNFFCAIGRGLRKVMNIASDLNYCLFRLVLLSLEDLAEMDSTVA